MDLPTLSIILSAAATGLGLVGLLLKISIRLAKIELKVETMWGFQMRRAVSEAVDSGTGKMNSPLVFTAKAKAALLPITPELRRFWKDLPCDVTDADALLMIEARFGDDLLRHVCLPCGLSHGACLLLALAIAKEADELDLDLTPPPRPDGWAARAGQHFARWCDGR